MDSDLRGYNMAGEEDLPPESSANLPALRPQGAQLEVIRPGSRLVSRIAGDAYRHLPSPSEKLWRVGDYEVNEQSYRQIMIWLDQIRVAGHDMTVEQFVKNNVNLVNDFWIERIRIVDFNITILDLSNSPNLTRLICSRNHLIELDLSGVANLVALMCDDNQIGELNLSCVSNMKKLWCGSNHLTELDLSHVPNLTQLYCQENKLTELDLSHVSKLTELVCSSNELTELDLTRVPNLQRLTCEGNQITELDISGCKTSEFRLECDPQVAIRKRTDQTVVRTSSQ